MHLVSFCRPEYFYFFPLFLLLHHALEWVFVATLVLVVDLLKGQVTGNAPLEVLAAESS